jgi:hypothetical protein
VKLKSDKDFTVLLEAIVDELLRADVHLIIAKGLAKSGKQYSEAINFARTFWSFTYQAHIESVLYHLCKVYDQHPSGFHLCRLLEVVKKNPEMFEIENHRKRLGKNLEDEIMNYEPVNQQQFQCDYQFVTEKNPLVEKLLKWRNNVLAHRNPKQILSQKPFEKTHPLPFTEIESLLKEGSEIVNRYSSHFGSVYYSRVTETDGWDDFSFVLESLSHHPRFVEYKKMDELYKEKS